MELTDILQRRHSVRSYKTQKVEEEKIKKILEAGRLAPTAANKQPFKIIVINTENREDEMRKICNRDWFAKAPVIICMCTVPSEAWVRNDGKNYADIDAAIAMDHMILTATDLGLGTCWVGAFHVDAAKKILGLEEGWEPVAFTPVGYTFESNSNKIRKDLDEIVIYK